MTDKIVSLSKAHNNGQVRNPKDARWSILQVNSYLTNDAAKNSIMLVVTRRNRLNTAFIMIHTAHHVTAITCPLCWRLEDDSPLNCGFVISGIAKHIP